MRKCNLFNKHRGCCCGTSCGTLGRVEASAYGKDIGGGASVSVCNGLSLLLLPRSTEGPRSG
jgi:hypothetical protein